MPGIFRGLPNDGFGRGRGHTHVARDRNDHIGSARPKANVDLRIHDVVLETKCNRGARVRKLTCALAPEHPPIAAVIVKRVVRVLNVYRAHKRAKPRRLDAKPSERDSYAVAGKWHEERRANRRVRPGKTPVTCLPVCRDARPAEVARTSQNAPAAMARRSRSLLQTICPNPPACIVWNRTGRTASQTNRQSSCTSGTSLHAV